MTDWQVGDSFPVDEPDPPRVILPPAVPPPPTKPPAPGFWRAWLGPLLISYLAYFFLGFLAAAVTLYHAFSLWKRSRRAALLALLLGPCLPAASSGFIRGVLDYKQSRPALYRAPKGAGAILDPQTRCYQRRSRGMQDAAAPFSLYPRASDFAVETMTRLYGPAGNHHRGRYPSRSEAFETLRLEKARVATWSRDDPYGERLGPIITRELGLAEPLDLTELISRNRRIRYRVRGWRSVAAFERRDEVRFIERYGTLFIGDDNLALLISRQTGELYACYEREND